MKETRHNILEQEASFDEVWAQIVFDIKDSRFMRIKSMLASDRGRLILYGAGEEGRKSLEFIRHCRPAGLEGVIYADTRKAGSFIVGLPCISLQELCDQYEGENIVITTARYEKEIFRLLLDKGIDCKQIFFLPSPAAMELEEFSEKHAAGYRWAYEFFGDCQSRECVVGRMRSYLLGDPVETNTSCDCYYESCIRLCDDEVFVDVGAYIGDTVEQFLLQAKVRQIVPKWVYAFEPTDSSQIAMKRLTGYENVQIIRKAVCGTNGMIQFFQNDSSMTLSSIEPNPFAETIFRCESITLDRFFETAEYMPTFIKIDAEGAESEIILGGKETIRRFHPKMAVRACHKPEDIYELTHALLELCPDYHFVLRQHEYCWYDTMLYVW